MHCSEGELHHCDGVLRLRVISLVRVCSRSGPASGNVFAHEVATRVGDEAEAAVAAKLVLEHVCDELCLGVAH